jgi:hypothetical protein
MSDLVNMAQQIEAMVAARLQELGNRPGRAVIAPFETPEQASQAGLLWEHMADQADELHDAIGDVIMATSNAQSAGDTPTSEVRRAADIAADLARAGKAGLENNRLPDSSLAKEAYQVTKEVEEKLLGFLREHPDTPRPLTLEVASPAHGELQVTGLARFVPARAVTSRDSAVVVEGDDCALRPIDHYHVRQVAMPFDPLLEPGSRARAAVVELIKDHSDDGIKRFQHEMRRLTETTEERDTQASLPVHDRPVIVATNSKLVQQGDRSKIAVTTHWEIMRSDVQVIDVLAASSALVESFAAAVTDPEPAGATRTFLRQALDAADLSDDAALLDHSTGLEEAATSVFALFGVNAVNHAGAVMVGAGNTLDPGMEVHRNRLPRDAVLDDLARIREACTTGAAGTKSAASIQALRLQRSRDVPGLPRRSQTLDPSGTPEDGADTIHRPGHIPPPAVL